VLALYRTIIHQAVPVSSCEVAEAAKLLENIFRSVNVALVNELKLVFDRMGIDVWEVIEAARTKPFGFMPFYPGPGLGGHCIPIDPFYLTWKAREFDLSTKFIELAGEVNTLMPYFVLDKVRQALNTKGKGGLRDRRVLVLGLAYKKDVEDTRESPAFKLIDLLEKSGAKVDYHDPFVPVLKPQREFPQLKSRRSKPLSAQTLKSSDLVLLTTNHTGLDYDLVRKHAPLIVDTRRVFTPEPGRIFGA
jgi:UDP-N-acetyl-D-glucosamine dehydrogenase